MSEKDFNELVDSYDPSYHVAPAILGHYSSYKRNTKAPVGAWIEKVKRVGTKILAVLKYPGEITVAVPSEFKELAEMPKFFKEVIGKALFKTKSIGTKRYEDGKLRIHHLAFLGSTVPQCKGLTDTEFQEHPELAGLVFEFGGEDDFNVIEEYQAMDGILEILIDLFGLDANATEEEVQGALKLRQAEKKKATEEAAALANGGLFAPVVGAPVDFAEKLNKSLSDFAEKLDAKITKLGTDLRKEFAEEVPPAPVPAPTPEPTPAVNQAVEVIEISATDAKAKADAATNDLKAKKNWLPAFDESLTPVLPILAAVKVGEKSALDSVIAALGAIEGLTEMNEELTGYRGFFDEKAVKEYSERNADASTPSNIAVPVGTGVMNEDIYKEVKEYSETHNISYAEAATKLGK